MFEVDVKNVTEEERRERKGRERKGKEGKGRERKGKEGKGRERKGKERKGREMKGKEGKEGKGREGKGREGDPARVWGFDLKCLPRQILWLYLYNNICSLYFCTWQNLDRLQQIGAYFVLDNAFAGQIYCALMSESR